LRPRQAPADTLARLALAPRPALRPPQALRFVLAPEGAPGAPSAYEVAGDAALEQRVGLVLVHACRQELASLGTTLQEDLALQAAAASGGGGGGGKGGKGGPGGARRADPAALAFRIEKKRVLAECLAALGGGGGEEEGGGGA
jgi:uncharacterized membrane protein YgcG